MKKVLGLSFKRFLELDPAEISDDRINLIEFWSQAEQEYAYLAETKRKNRLLQYNSFIRLQIDDITHPLAGLHLMSDEDAQRLIKFIEKHLGETFVVHCNEGISRTGAVVYILDRYYGYFSGERWLSRGRSGHYNANRYILAELEKCIRNNTLWWKVLRILKL